MYSILYTQSFGIPSVICEHVCVTECSGAYRKQLPVSIKYNHVGVKSPLFHIDSSSSLYCRRVSVRGHRWLSYTDFSLNNRRQNDSKAPKKRQQSLVFERELKAAVFFEFLHLITSACFTDASWKRARQTADPTSWMQTNSKQQVWFCEAPSLFLSLIHFNLNSTSPVGPCGRHFTLSQLQRIKKQEFIHPAAISLPNLPMKWSSVHRLQKHFVLSTEGWPLIAPWMWIRA